MNTSDVEPVEVIVVPDTPEIAEKKQIESTEEWEYVQQIFLFFEGK